MVIIALLLECLKTSANVARLHRVCGSRAELSRAHGGGASDHCVLARALAHRDGSPHFHSWVRKSALPEPRNQPSETALPEAEIRARDARFCGQAVQNLCFVWVQDIGVGA